MKTPGVQWTKPIIKDYDGDLEKRWYVFYQYRHPDLGKLHPFKRYAHINRIKTITGRMQAIKQLRKELEELLQSGFSPFKAYVPETHKATPEATPVAIAIDHVVDLKKAYLKKSSFKTFEARINIFKAYLEKQDKSHLPGKDLTRSDITNFLSWVQKDRGIGNFSRNNYLADVKGLFTKLVEEEYIYRNPTLKIADLPAKPRKNRAFTAQQIESIKNWLLQNDPQLYLYIRWVTYAFLRPVEVCRIRIKHIDLENGLLYIPTKTKSEKVKRIIPRLMEDLEKLDLHQYKPEDLLFTLHGKPGPWQNRVGKEEADDMRRRTYFGNRFKALKKELGLGPEYGIYSFRHSAVGDIYTSLREAGFTGYHAKMMMLPITGHETMQALEKYLREAQIEIADDHSVYINLKF